MAILPTQMRMVYQIGQAHGVALDRGHIKEFLVAAGVGLSSQVVEAYAPQIQARSRNLRLQNLLSR